MGPKNPSSGYFEKVAREWDSIRAGYFDGSIRDRAIARAFLRPDMDVADVGAGTGYLSTALALLVRHVYVLDGSAAMLAVAMDHLKGFSNVEFREADSQALPLPDASVDAVFANMYLHHCPDPLAAIHEMARILRPGGRLVISDMESHPYEWFKDEMADVWTGFDRSQVRAWYQAAGLVNVIVDNPGTSCCAGRKEGELAGQKVTIAVFSAVGTRPQGGVEESVRSHYAAHAGQGTSCCAPQKDTYLLQPTRCCSETTCPSAGQVYLAGDLGHVPEEVANFSLGCGNPGAFAQLRPGDVVLDIGSGGGLDALLAAERVGPTGKVIGVDMTPEMLARARAAAAKGGYRQVEFRAGRADELPVESDSVDVAVSNCVINLCVDKGRVFEEAFRVLKAGGRLVVSDMVTSGAMPSSLIADENMWSECISGALPEQEYLDLAAQAGFTSLETFRSAEGFDVGDVRVYSLSLTAYKPGENSQEGAAACSCDCGDG